MRGVLREQWGWQSKRQFVACAPASNVAFQSVSFFTSETNKDRRQAVRAKKSQTNGLHAHWLKSKSYSASNAFWLCLRHKTQKQMVNSTELVFYIMTNATRSIFIFGIDPFKCRSECKLAELAASLCGQSGGCEITRPKWFYPAKHLDVI